MGRPAAHLPLALAAGMLVTGAAMSADAGAATTTQAIPAWVHALSFKGDFRYRNETIDQQLRDRRNRDRLRVRAGFTARVNDTVRAEVGLATSEDNDPRSSNVTLGASNSRKDIYFDLAYVEWQALPSLKLLGGKMKYPWQRPGTSTLFDGDLNPEGLAAAWQQGDVFASAFHYFLDERADASESTLQGAQFGWKPALGEGRLTLAAAWFDFHRVRARDPFHAGNPHGNTTTTTGCQGGAQSCLVHDYDLLEAFAEYSHPLAGRPLVVFADLITNQAAGSSEDTAWSAGVTWGRAADPRQWEVGYTFQEVQKDAVFAQFVDSDVGAGSTDHRAHVFRAAYAVAKNWILNATYQRAQTDLAVPVVIAGNPVRGRDYERLQLDLNFRF